MTKYLPLANLGLLLLLGYQVFFKQNTSANPTFEEIRAERLSIVGPDGHLYISISNPERQALATTHGVPHYPDSERDLPGLIFFNRVGDEVGGIFYDGTDEESYGGITFDQQKNDQILAIMKDEYLEEGEWKRWYGLFLRERQDSVRVDTLYERLLERTQSLSEAEKRAAYMDFKQALDSTVNVYRLFLGREANRETGLFIYDSKGKPRIKLYVDEADRTRFELLDQYGQPLKSPTLE